MGKEAGLLFTNPVGIYDNYQVITLFHHVNVNLPLR